MTKAKADQTIGIRLEMQKFERDQLERLVTARAVGDVLNGVGAVLDPFGKAFAVIVAAYIAKEGADKLIGKWDEFRAEGKQKATTRATEDYLKQQAESDPDGTGQTKPGDLTLEQWTTWRRWTGWLF